MKILGLIPARGGSKGIPNKNRRELGGKPLLQYTAEAALASQLLDRVIFSSEDTILINLAKKLGLETPFLRPFHLSQDASGSLEVVQHALQFLIEKGEHYDAVCLLQATTPFRNSKMIDEAISIFIAEKKDALISVQEVPHQYNPHWVFEADKAGELHIATGETNIIKRRQELPKAFIRDGGIYITKSEVILRQNSFFGNTLSYIITDSETNINIDTEDDWLRAEAIIKKIDI